MSLKKKEFEWHIASVVQKRIRLLASHNGKNSYMTHNIWHSKLIQQFSVFDK